MVLPAAAAMSFNLIWNRTASLPLGIWHKTEAFHLTPSARGRYVLFCPPTNTATSAASSLGALSRGSCPGGYLPLIKQIIGLPGDQIDLGSSVTVNHTPVVNSTIDTAAAALIGLRLPQRLVVKAGSLWLMSTYNPESFDSRYFGEVDAAKVLGFVEPLLTF